MPPLKLGTPLLDHLVGRVLLLDLRSLLYLRLGMVRVRMVVVHRRLAGSLCGLQQETRTPALLVLLQHPRGIILQPIFPEGAMRSLRCQRQRSLHLLSSVQAILVPVLLELTAVM